MNLPPNTPILDLNSPTFAADFKAAIGLKEGEKLEIMTPQFDRTDGRQIETPKLPLEDWKNLPQLSKEDLVAMGLGIWNSSHLGTHFLYPKEWYDFIPNGLEIAVIDGTTEFFEHGKTDDDTRFGLLAYGFIKP